MNKIRHLRSSDIPHLFDLSSLAGWNQTAADWERMLALAPDSCFGIEAGGRIVSTTTVIRYAELLAWVGMVLTHPDHQGRGNATTLLNHAIQQTRHQGVAWVKLDATEAGRPIYARMGFVEECGVERWKRPAGGGPPMRTPQRIHQYVVDPSFDRAYFGALRVPLLAALAKGGEAGYVTGYGYAMGRAGSRATYFGPCVVRTRDSARLLLEWFLSRHFDEDIFWDLFPDNKDAVQLAIDYGFEPNRQLTRMGLSCKPGQPPLLRHDSGVFAIAGFEYG